MKRKEPVSNSDSDSDSVGDYKSLKREKKEKDISSLDPKTQSQNTQNKQKYETRASLKNGKQTNDGNKGKRRRSSTRQNTPTKKNDNVSGTSPDDNVDKTENTPSCSDEEPVVIYNRTPKPKSSLSQGTLDNYVLSLSPSKKVFNEATSVKQMPSSSRSSEEGKLSRKRKSTCNGEETTPSTKTFLPHSAEINKTKIEESGQDTKKGNKSDEKLEEEVAKTQQSKDDKGPKKPALHKRSTSKACPPYKKIADTKITVDAFNYGIIPGCQAYFLSHFHSDHYTGLTKKFQQPIYCSKITANLVRSILGVNKKYVNVLPMEESTEVEGVEVTLLDANHCPGAVMFLFKPGSGKVYLHTGDFRADPSMERYPALMSVKVDELYLDTTYYERSNTFPPQKDVIKFVVSLVQRELQTNPKTLIVCGSYIVGKERMFKGISEALQCKICVEKDRKNVIDCLEDEELRSRVSLNVSDSNLHVLPMHKLKLESLDKHLSTNKKYTKLMAFKPTSWLNNMAERESIPLHKIRPKIRNGIKLYDVPYSEHSNFQEMKRFVKFIKADKIILTVCNDNEQKMENMEKIFKCWMDETRHPASIENWVKRR